MKVILTSLSETELTLNFYEGLLVNLAGLAIALK